MHLRLEPRPAPLRITHSIAALLATLATALAVAQTASADAGSEAEAARLMLDNQAIVEVSANECKTRFPTQGAAIDSWLAAWHTSDANLIAAAETINAKSATPTLGAERRATAEAKVSPGFNGAAGNDQLASFCSGVFSPGTQDRLRASQPKTVQFLSDAYERFQRSGELLK